MLEAPRSLWEGIDRGDRGGPEERGRPAPTVTSRNEVAVRLDAALSRLDRLLDDAVLP